MLTAVVAMDPNRLIGRDGTLPWHLPEDLAFFKKTTLGHPVLMGRKTFESIGRPLPKRRNIVLTRDHDWKHDGVDIIHSPSEIPKTDEKIFIIGGAEIYRALTEQIIPSRIRRRILYSAWTEWNGVTAEFCETQNIRHYREAQTAGRLHSNLNPSLSATY